MNRLTRQALSLSRFTGPAASFMKFYIEKTAEEWRTLAKAEAVPPPGLSDPWPHPLSSSPSSVNGVCKKHRRACRMTRAVMEKYSKKDRKKSWACTHRLVTTETITFIRRVISHSFPTCRGNRMLAKYLCSPIF